MTETRRRKEGACSGKAAAWNDGTRVYLSEPVEGASRTLWVDMYDGPDVTPDNIDDPEVVGIVVAARQIAARTAAHWRSMSYEQARAEYDAL